jgi:hypothetical protein
MSYEDAYKAALESFKHLDLADVSFNSSTGLSGDSITVPFLGGIFIISEKGNAIIRIDSKNEVKIAEKIILLHYLITADGTPLSRDLITLENIQGASFYFPTYKARTIDLLLRYFGNDSNLFANKCRNFKANIESTTPGNISEKKAAAVKATFLILPNIPVSIVYHPGDKEFLPDIKILYDANIEHYLPLEDIIVMTELLTHKIIKADNFKGNTPAVSTLI